MTNQSQAAAWRIRRRNRSQQFIAAATAWRAGLIVVPNDVVQSNGMAWIAQNGGTTAGGVGPNNSSGALFTDGGGVQWLHTPLLLTIPTPI
ncbi:MAG TPA: hypothetical protein VMV59_06985 [Candidatus Dormibacteraeota bacterium]|nr:hypothetical protein [Candidatus Dormibacteraeota bacterium]